MCRVCDTTFKKLIKLMSLCLYVCLMVVMWLPQITYSKRALERGYWIVWGCVEQRFGSDTVLLDCTTHPSVSPLCDQCQVPEHTLSHAFWFCPLLTGVWDKWTMGKFSVIWDPLLPTCVGEVRALIWPLCQGPGWDINLHKLCICETPVFSVGDGYPFICHICTFVF